MGKYFNPDNIDFRRKLASPVYVDKSGLISLLNPRIGVKDDKNLCVSRARRFGKTWTADMLKAYYSRGCDSRALFEKLAVAADPSFAKHLNDYDVVHVNMAEFYLAADRDVERTIRIITEKVGNEIYGQYPDVRFDQNDALSFTLADLFEHAHRKIIFIVDEWDHILRDRPDHASQKRCLDFLCLLFRDKGYVGLCYLTGILPMRRLIGASDACFFTDRSVIKPHEFAPFVGFTEAEVLDLCLKFDMDFEMMKSWYDGYRYENVGSVFCPLSVTSAIEKRDYDDYWNQAGAFETVRDLMNKDFRGLRDAAVKLLAGESVKADSGSCLNDLNDLGNSNDVLTILAHLGYLSFASKEWSEGQAFIPNWETARQFAAAVQGADLPGVRELIGDSKKILEATWRLDGAFVAEKLDEVRALETSILRYDDEISLARLICLAYFAA
ncbi:MAG: AAA family ATPase [Deltaproteobacteria bacterium]|jgi:hypothetical protein|nr:AAA family ATPase [Deltaproteobacteria bacterium]